jgi:hypothetical protein
MSTAASPSQAFMATYAAAYTAHSTLYEVVYSR